MLAIGLFVVLASNLAGIFIFFEFQKWDIRREVKAMIKQNLPDADLTAITLSPELHHNLTWQDETEFEYHGILYDVVRQKKLDDGSIVYYCLQDAKETDLFTSLADLLDKAVNSRKNCKTPVNNFFSLFTQICLPPVETTFRPYLRNADINRATQAPYASPFLTISSPPPKLV